LACGDRRGAEVIYTIGYALLLLAAFTSPIWLGALLNRR
jgi:hypothetical protein